jgi:hypothetical protein
MNGFRQVEGYIVTLQCAVCGRQFPHFRPAGDADTDTAGVGSLSSCEENTVVVAELSPTESNEFEGGGAKAFEERLAKQLGRADLRSVRLLRVEKTELPAGGPSFQDFRKQYAPPILVYTCVCCLGGESKPIGELTVDEFRRNGGQVLMVAPLALLESHPHP